MLSAKLLFEYLQYNYSKMKRVFNENGKRITSLKDFIVILADDNFDKNWVANDEILYLKIKELKKRFSSLSKIKNAFYQMELVKLLYHNGYPPKWSDEVFEKVLQQAENFKKYN